jgi:hypothetical protein
MRTTDVPVRSALPKSTSFRPAYRATTTAHAAWNTVRTDTLSRLASATTSSDSACGRSSERISACGGVVPRGKRSSGSVMPANVRFRNSATIQSEERSID